VVVSRFKPRKQAVVALAAVVGLLSISLEVCIPAPGEAASVTAGTRVAVYLTTSNLSSKADRLPDLTFRPGVPTGGELIRVNPDRTYQKLTAGFGVAMTDSAAYLIDKQLPSSLRSSVMQALFSPTKGIGLSFLRIPIGGSDYVVGTPYTYDDMPPGQSDPTLAHFSLAHDRAYVIPIMRQALGLNPSISVMANPWTPPAWMKTDGVLVTTTGATGTLKPADYGVFAHYLVKFLKGYQAAGIPIRFLGVQNEPLTPLLKVAGIPESYLSPEDEGRLIHDFVAPALRRAGLHPTILALDDDFNDAPTYVPPLMAAAGAEVGGLAYHCYFSNPSIMTTEHSRYPKQVQLETECASYLSNLQPAQMAIRSLRNWAQGIQLWTAAVDQQGGPKMGHGCLGYFPPHQGLQCIAPVTVDTTTHTFSLTSDFWALAQFSRFIRLGATRIASTTPSNCGDSATSGYDCGLEDVTFRNPNGSTVMVATTNDGRPHEAVVTVDGQSFSFQVPNGATVTFVWPAPNTSARP
jgi:glucosylceramidase